MARTGQPSRERVGSAATGARDARPARRERAARNERDRAPHGHDAEHRLAPPRARSSRRGLVEHDARDRPLPARPPPRAPRELGARAPGRARDRTSAPRSARRGNRRDRRRSRCPAEPDAITVDFVASPHYVARRHEPRPAVRRARDGGGEGDARVRRTPPGAAAPRLHRAHDRGPRRARRRARAHPQGRLGRGLRGARARAERDRRAGLVGGGELAAIVAVQGPVPRFGRAVARKALPLLLEHAAAISAELGFSTGR